MDAQKFLTEFGHIANAPGGIGQLRNMIYQLAITGSLTPQTSAGSNAQMLLAEIGRLREQLVRAKKYKRLPKLEAQALSVPSGIDLPASWCWTRLLDIGEISPRNDAEDEARASFIPMSGIPQLHQGALFAEAARWRDIKKGFTHFANGDVVVAKITPCFENGKAACITGLEHGVGAGTTELHVFRPIHPGVLSGYVYLFLRSPYFAIEGERNMTGTAGQKRLPTDYFATRAFPLPPKDEQARIVVKVDELMALCDRLETQQQQRRSLQNNLRKSTLQAVAAAISPHELQTTWARLAENFGQLFDLPEDVADIRTMIHELAIRGAIDELSEPKDSATIDLYLTEIAKKKSAKRFAKAAHADEEMPLPNGWRWVLLEELLVGSESGWSPQCDSEPRNGDEWGVLKVSAVTWGSFDARENKRLPLSLEPRTECEVKSGDFLLSRANTAALVARSVIAPIDCPEKLLMSDKIVRLQFADDALKPWVNLVNNSESARQYYKARATGTSDSMRNVSRQVIHELPVPLPTLQVQRRVLAHVQRLARFCDEMERHLSSIAKIGSMLSTSVVSSITGIAIEPEKEEPVKAPQTEIVAPLRLGTLPAVADQSPLATMLSRNKGSMNAGDLFQRYGKPIDEFYAQLKLEISRGWIDAPPSDPEVEGFASVRLKEQA